MATQRDRISSKLREAAETGKKRENFFSFGDDGLTATVGASGRLLRISQHFPGEDVGFCVDDREMPEPYYVVERLEKLLETAADTPSGDGIGARIDVPNYPDGSQHVDMINHRWPTFHRILEDRTRFSIQYAASGKTIYQRFKFCNDTKASECDKSGNGHLSLLKIRPDLLIRNLDFVDPVNELNKEGPGATERYVRFRERGNSIIREHSAWPVGGRVSLRILALDNTDSLEFVSQENPPKALSRARESKSSWVVRSKTRNSDRNPEHFEEHSIILAYTLQLDPIFPKLVAEFPQLSWNDASTTIDRLLRPCADHIWSDHPTLNLSLNRNLEYILSVCSIPVPTKLGEESPIALTCGDVDSHRVATAASL